ncbi:MAG: hypothetical protein ACE1Z4_03650, partial [Gammaproteobacteria bacterium]
WRWDIGEGQNGNTNAPENLRFQEVLEKGGRAIELASCVDRKVNVSQRGDSGFVFAVIACQPYGLDNGITAHDIS